MTAQRKVEPQDMRRQARRRQPGVEVAGAQPPGLDPEPQTRRAATEAVEATEAAHLLRRAPMAYVWNQLGSLWLFASSFLLTLTVARGLGTVGYGVFAVALTIFNSAVYLAAFGLEDAATVYVPRTLASTGRGAASGLIRRLVVARALGVALVSAALAWGLPALAHGATALRLPGAAWLVGATHAPALATLALPVAAYVAGTGLMNQLNSILTALLRTRLTLIVGGLSQVANVAGVLALTRLHIQLGAAGTLGRVSAAIWALAVVAWLTAVVYGLFLLPLLRAGRPAGGAAQPFGPVLRLGGSAWLTNLITSALLKQTAVSLLQFFAIGVVAIGYFNLAFQLAHAAAYLLVAGLGGVGMAAMAASYAGGAVGGLGSAWRAVSKVQMLLAVPLLAFSAVHASDITVVLYGPRYAAVGPLMLLFLLFTLAQRLAGSGSHQAALYVLGRQWLAFGAQVEGLIVTVILGLILIPQRNPWGGAAGALIAVGVGQVSVELLQLTLAWRFLRRPYPVSFAARICLALLPPLALVALWRPQPRALSFPLHLPPPLDGLTALTISSTFLGLLLAGLAFAALLALCLALTKPLEQEDVTLLAEVNSRLRWALAPFAHTTRDGHVTPPVS